MENDKFQVSGWHLLSLLIISGGVGMLVCLMVLFSSPTTLYRHIDVSGWVEIALEHGYFEVAPEKIRAHSAFREELSDALCEMLAEEPSGSDQGIVATRLVFSGTEFLERELFEQCPDSAIPEMDFRKIGRLTLHYIAERETPLTLRSEKLEVLKYGDFFSRIDEFYRAEYTHRLCGAYPDSCADLVPAMAVIEDTPKILQAAISAFSERMTNVEGSENVPESLTSLCADPSSLNNVSLFCWKELVTQYPEALPNALTLFWNSESRNQLIHLAVAQLRERPSDQFIAALEKHGWRIDPPQAFSLVAIEEN